MNTTRAELVRCKAMMLPIAVAIGLSSGIIGFPDFDIRLENNDELFTKVFGKTKTVIDAEYDVEIAAAKETSNGTDEAGNQEGA